MSRRKASSRHRNPRIPKLSGKGLVFCDEAGFTGDNLLDSAQEVFTFAGVSIEEGCAREVVERTIRDFRLQGAELKGGRMLKTEPGNRGQTGRTPFLGPI
jgi:hypothetical protein